MGQRQGIGAADLAAAVEAYRRYREVVARAKGRISPEDDAWIRAGLEAAVDAADRSRLTLQTLATVAHCGLSGRRSREALRDWQLIAGSAEGSPEPPTPASTAA